MVVENKVKKFVNIDNQFFLSLTWKEFNIFINGSFFFTQPDKQATEMVTNHEISISPYFSTQHCVFTSFF